MIHGLFKVLGPKQAPRSGRHKLAGTITVDGVPASRVVAVLDRRSFERMATTTSNHKTGKWEVVGLPERPEKALVVVAFDNTGKYNAEVADYVSQVATV